MAGNALFGPPASEYIDLLLREHPPSNHDASQILRDNNPTPTQSFQQSKLIINYRLSFPRARRLNLFYT